MTENNDWASVRERAEELLHANAIIQTTMPISDVQSLLNDLSADPIELALEIGN